MEKLIPIWGDACDGQKTARSSEWINLFGSPSLALLLGLTSGDAHFIQLWEDLVALGDDDIPRIQSVMAYPLLWLPSAESIASRSDSIREGCFKNSL